MNTNFDVAVIGNGLIGAAATRYLSATGQRVAGIGPGEPADWKKHSGVFASHYDQGRITRIIDPDPIWARLGQRAMAAYAALEAQSGIKFHQAASCLRVSPDPTAPGDTLRQAEQVARELNAPFTLEQEGEGLQEIFPFLCFTAGAQAIWERGAAGYVNPRQLVQAQLTAATQQGATIIPAAVTTIKANAAGSTVTIANGDVVTARKVLLAAGAYSGWLLARPLALRRKAVTVVLAELGDTEAARLRAKPSIIYRLDNHPVLASIYSLPPIRYPDGKIYLKLGGTLREPRYLESAAALEAWFHTDGNPVEAAALREVLLAMIPNLAASRFQSKPCVVTYTEHDRPYIDQIDDGIYVATGGCGSAAKSADAIGCLGARLVDQGRWTDVLPATAFAVRYAA
ncbi:MAG: FAD-dependent oxidoreductase [Caldilineaceae bacterium]|nr:FAD-dependent oxidoreductase [Caldilineaceae bacterium]